MGQHAAEMVVAEKAGALPRPSRRRWRFRLRIVLLLGLAAVAALYLYVAHSINQDLREAIAQTDRLDPGWMVEDLDRGRVAVPDADNAWLVIVAIHKRLSVKQSWPSQPVYDALKKHVPATPLDEAQLALLRAELQKVDAVRNQARTLAALPRGTLPIRNVADWDQSVWNTMQRVRLVSCLLQHDAWVRAHDGDPAEALRSCRAALHTGRALGVHGTLMCSFVRVASRELALQGIEDTLALTCPDDADLASLQQLLMEEEAVPLLLGGLRGERAFQHQCLTDLETGKVRISRSRSFTWYGDDQEPPPVADAYDMLGQPMVEYVHGWLLHQLTTMVETAKTPIAAQIQCANQMTVQPVSLANLVLANFWTTSRIGTAFHRDRARVRAMIAALAVERYRIKHGDWPATLADVAPTPLPASWTDPFDGAPLRYRRRFDGVVIYSVGADGKDDGGKLDHQQPGAGFTDVGVRLLDADQRRAP